MKKLLVKTMIAGVCTLLSVAPLQAQTNQYRQDRILVKPRVGDLAALHQQLGTRVLRSYPQIENIQVVQLPQGMTVPQAIAAFLNSGLVWYAEPDYLYYLAWITPPLYLSSKPEGEQLQFYWSDIGTNYVYTLEGTESLASTNWFPVPGAAWRLQTNHWTLPLTNAPARFYRIRAEQSSHERSDDDGQDLLFRTLAQGGYSGIGVASNLIIRSEAEWKTFWLAHQANLSPPIPVPFVDFDKEMVVAVTMGLGATGGFDIAVERIARVANRLGIFVTRQTPATNCYVTQAFTSPFHFAAVAKNDLDPDFVMETKVTSCP